MRDPLKLAVLVAAAVTFDAYVIVGLRALWRIL
jgi:hypothetical protein